MGDDEAGSRRRAPSSRRLVLLGVLLLLVALVPLLVLRSPSSSAALELGAVDASADAEQVRIRSTVRSPSGNDKRFRVWYTLSQDEAQAPAFTSATVLGSVQGTQETAVELTDPITVPPGSYLLELWVHERDRTDFGHADHQSTLIDLTEARPALLRSDGPERLRVEQVQVDLGEQNPVVVDGTIEVRNLTDEPLDATVEVGVVGAGTAEADSDADDPDASDDEADAAAAGPVWVEGIPVRLAPLAVEQVDVSGLVAVLPGSKRTRVLVRDGSDVEVVLDDVQVAAASDVDLDSSVVRTSLPQGDVMVSGAAVPVEWDDGTRRELEVTAVNLGDGPREVWLYASVTASEDPEPWSSSRARCAPVSVELVPREPTTATIGCTMGSPVDELATIVWAQEATGEDGGATDQVAAAQQTTVVPNPLLERRVERALGEALIDRVAAPETVTPEANVEVTVTVTNLMAEERATEVWWVLYGLTDDPDAAPVVQAGRVPVTLGPGEQVEVAVPGLAPAEARAFQLSAVVHTASGDDIVHGDQVWFQVPLRVAP